MCLYEELLFFFLRYFIDKQNCVIYIWEGLGGQMNIKILCLLLSIAVLSGHLAAKQALNGKQIDFIFEQVKAGKSKQVKELLESGLAADLQNEEGLVLLSQAALYGKKKIVNLLLEHNADPNYLDKDGTSAMMYAAWMGYDDIVAILVRAGSKVNQQNVDGYTALMLASWRGHLSTARYLIYQGADLNMLNNRGESAWYLAMTSKFKKIGVLLEQYGSLR